MNLETNEIALYFEELGYEMDWDFEGNSAWLEVKKDKKTLFNINMSASLEEVIKDFSFLGQHSETVKNMISILHKYNLNKSDLNDPKFKKLLASVKTLN